MRVGPRRLYHQSLCGVCLVGCSNFLKTRTSNLAQGSTQTCKVRPAAHCCWLQRFLCAGAGISVCLLGSAYVFAWVYAPLEKSCQNTFELRGKPVYITYIWLGCYITWETPTLHVFDVLYYFTKRYIPYWISLQHGCYSAFTDTYIIWSVKWCKLVDKNTYSFKI